MPEPGESSAPWERPRRWAHSREDATRVEDLLARLSGSGLPAEPRRRRRDSEDDDAVPAGDLIAALAADTGDGETAGDEAPAGEVGATGDAGSAGDEAPAGDGDPAGDETAQPTVRSTTAARPAAGPADAAAADENAGTTERPAGAGPDDETAVIPVVSADQTPSPGEPAPAATTAAATDDSWQSVRASLQRRLGVEGASAAAAAPGPPRPPRGPTTGQRHRSWWIAGRSIVAAISAFLLVAFGTEWVILARADAALADRNVSAIVPDDTNISTPTAVPTDPANPGDTAVNAPNPDGTAKTYQAENILMMGSDSRASAEDYKLGGSGTVTMQSDVLMVLHIAADRSHVTVVSIPRDTYVKAPTCKAWDYATNSLSDKDYPNQYSEWKITNAYSVGGPQCTVRAVQKLTGLRINRVIIIDFAGFKTMVDALGGITVNACRPIVDDPKYGIGTVLPRAGEQHINGTQALKLVRARHVEGDTESDLARIKRQQKVLSTMLSEATSAGVLLNPAKLNALLQAFVHNVHTDNVTLEDLLNIAQSLGNLDPKRVTFYTLPTVPDGDGEDMTKAGSVIWNALVNDRALPGEVTAPPEPLTTSSSASSTASSTESEASSTARTPTPSLVTRVITSRVTSTPSAPAQDVTVAPGEVDLQVVNVAGRGGVATQAMNALNPLGFDISDPDLLLIPGDVRDGITVEYSSDNRAAAVTVAAAVPGATLVPTDGLGSKVRLMLGSSFDGTVQQVSVGDPVPSALSTTPSPLVSTVLSTEVSTTTPAPAPSTTPSTSTSTSTETSTSKTTSTQPALTSGEVQSINAGSAGCI